MAETTDGVKGNFDFKYIWSSTEKAWKILIIAPNICVLSLCLFVLIKVIILTNADVRLLESTAVLVKLQALLLGLALYVLQYDYYKHISTCI